MWYLNKNETNYECKGVPEVSTTKYPEVPGLLAPTSKTKAKRAKYKASLLPSSDTINLGAIPEPGLTTTQNKYIDICWSSNSIVGNMPYQETTKKENNMQSLEQNTRDYFLNRIATIYRDKTAAAYKTFKMGSTPGPISPEDMVRMIKDGLYEIPKKYTDAFVIEQNREDYPDDADTKQIVKDRFYYRDAVSSFITWKDPENAPDPEGYEAELKKLKAEMKKLQDAVYSLPVAEATKLIQDWEASA